MKYKVEKIIYFRPYWIMHEYFTELYAIAKEKRNGRLVSVLEDGRLTWERI